MIICSWSHEPRVEADGRNQRTGTKAKVKNDVHQTHQPERGSNLRQCRIYEGLGLKGGVAVGTTINQQGSSASFM